MRNQYSQAAFDEKRRKEGWTRIGTYGSVAAVQAFLAGPDGKKWIEPEGASLDDALKEAKNFEGLAVSTDVTGADIFTVDRSDTEGHLSLVNRKINVVQSWSFQIWLPDTRWILGRLAEVAAGTLKKKHPGAAAAFVQQKDQAFMWKAPSIHPMQIRENAYQRLVLTAGRKNPEDAQQAESAALERFFATSEGVPGPLLSAGPRAEAGLRWAAVRMNHSIDSFYLFRLLIGYEARGDTSVLDPLRIDLTDALTTLLHSGSPAQMGWLSTWLTMTITDLGKRMTALNTQLKEDAPPDRKNEDYVIFFLKGGRALNYFLKTPDEGKNDWDTQVVINPSLAPSVWYKTFAEVHDELLQALQLYNTQFTDLIEKNCKSFQDHLTASQVEPPSDEDEGPPNINEVEEARSLPGRVNCKAELIDIALPRRDSAAAIEEWEHLSPKEGLLRFNPQGEIVEIGGVIVPGRPYYVNEYLTMIREAFLPDAKTHKLTKRVNRLQQILDPAYVLDVLKPDGHRLGMLPQTMAKLNDVPDPRRQQLLTTIASQFARAYSLTQDALAADHFDKEMAAGIEKLPPLPPQVANAVPGSGWQARDVLVDVGLAASLSQTMIEYTENQDRDGIGSYPRALDAALGAIVAAVGPTVRKMGGQVAVAGSYAARLHAEWQGSPPVGFEPVRRILVQLHCPASVNEVDMMNSVRGLIVARLERPEFAFLAPEESRDLKKRSLSFVAIYGTERGPQLLKVRACSITGRMPTLVSIQDLPVLGLRSLVAAYLRKTAMTQEFGRHEVLSTATSALLEMMSNFDERSDIAAEAAVLE